MAGRDGAAGATAVTAGKGATAHKLLSRKDACDKGRETSILGEWDNEGGCESALEAAGGCDGALVVGGGCDGGRDPGDECNCCVEGISRTCCTLGQQGECG